MRRGKPQQEIYRPGSGPLRKTTGADDYSEPESQVNVNKAPHQPHHHDEVRYRDEPSPSDPNVNARKPRKPEQMIYTPRAVISAREAQEAPPVTNGNDDSDRFHAPRSKRYSNRRRGNDNNGSSGDHNRGGDEWRDKSLSRQYRQGSEPRGATSNGNPRNVRDTRSVEPSAPLRNYPEKHSKPPSGRRHSTIGLENDKPRQMHKPINVEKLPPRLRKKFLEENKLTSGQGGVDDNWNGSSMTFQGTSGGTTSGGYHQPNQSGYYTIGGGHNHSNYPNQKYNNLGYSTLPSRGRGRARIHGDNDNYRSRTPDLGASPCSSRPPTPPHSRTRSNDNLNRYDNRALSPAPGNYHGQGHGRSHQAPQHQQQQQSQQQQQDYSRGSSRNERRNFPRGRNHSGERKGRDDCKSSENWADQYEESTGGKVAETAESSPVSPATPEEPIKMPVISLGDDCLISKNFDWSEDVELEAGALSDALTRSSSVTSLVDLSAKSTPSNTHSNNNTTNNNNNSHNTISSNNNNNANRSTRSKRKSGRRNKRRSGSGGPRDAPRDTFKIPQEPPRRTRRQSRDSSYDRRSRPPSREPSFDRRNSTSTSENWREEIIRSRRNSEREGPDNQRGGRRDSEQRDSDPKPALKKPGVLVLPSTRQNVVDHPKYPDVSGRKTAAQKSLFDHNNPTKPIIVKSPGSRVSVPGFSDNSESAPPPMVTYTTDPFGNIRPGWYDEHSEGFKSCHYPSLIRDIRRADTELQNIINAGAVLTAWGTVESLRLFLREALQYFLCKDLKFCEAENVEQHLWKILYHNVIEVTRKAITNDPGNKEQYKGFLLYLIDEGTGYFEGLVETLEETYKFKVGNFIGSNYATSHKGLGYVGLALVSVQKVLMFLGDLGRYREQVNESSNYGKCRQWYVKALEVNPKNGRPYNQLAILASYARRKLDAVYYYMRSLMSSNPVPSARERLIALFDENRKKYEQGERKRREERLERAKQHMKQKESEENASNRGSFRHETWIRPGGGRRVHRTTQAVQDRNDSEEEDLAALSSVEVNKRFVTSYLHVHSKLITKIGMESFQEAAMQMLKEFRALLQHSPVPLPCNRFLQLLALNMFAIESTQLKDLQMQAGYRSELQERALVVSLQMFNLILERCVSLLQEYAKEDPEALPQDIHVLLPAVKIWCDWMLCHSSVWNPPPSTQDFKVGSPGDSWGRLAVLMNLLEKLEQTTACTLLEERTEGCEAVRLPEDGALSGFTPLMVNDPDVSYASTEIDLDLARFALRVKKLLFFGTVFLCGLEPPVLKLEIEDEFREYVSVVCTSNGRNSPSAAAHPELARRDEVLMESFSEGEDDEELEAVGPEAPEEVRDLLSRKVELERTQRRQELHKQRVKKILSQAVVSVHIEVRPKYLVPDTNCFIDHLEKITAITASHVYTLMVPIVVMSELEGLSRGGRSPAPSTRSSLDPQHVRKVALAARSALSFLKSRPQMVKCVTTKGAVLSSTTFTTEDDSSSETSVKNDDKILATCLVLSKGHNNANKEQENAEEGVPKKLVSEVVLLTDDRNLRVKALARDVPVRELADFLRWAGLG